MRDRRARGDSTLSAADDQQQTTARKLEDSVDVDAMLASAKR